MVNQHVPHRHLLVLYVIVAIIGVWLLLLSTPDVTGDTQEEWVCLQQVCSQSEPGGDLWVQENCGVIEDDQGNPVEACQVVIDGVEQLVALQEINTSAIRNCVEYTCVQEVRVREANYTLDPSVIAG